LFSGLIQCSGPSTFHLYPAIIVLMKTTIC